MLRSEEWLRRCRESCSGEAAWLAAGAGVAKGSADCESLAARLEMARRVLLEVGRAAPELEARIGKVTLEEGDRGASRGRPVDQRSEVAARAAGSAPGVTDRARHEPPRPRAPDRAELCYANPPPPAWENCSRCSSRLYLDVRPGKFDPPGLAPGPSRAA